MGRIVLKVSLLLLFSIILELSPAFSNSGFAQVNLEAAGRLLKRVLNSSLHEEFVFAKLDDKIDVFEYEGLDNGRIKVAASSTSALTAGLGWYLKYEANVHFSWMGNQVKSISGLRNLPKPQSKVRMTRQGPFSYYQNVCTVSYSMVWWDLSRWLQELDWMALSGINLPLAFTGQEYIWLSVMEELGVARDQVLSWLGGPAFMAWQRMGNIRAWGGPMPMSWINNQKQLQLGILTRMRELGMKPVLPAFAGHVPFELQELFPHAKITSSSRWGRFNSSYTPVAQVEPTDPLFLKIGEMYIKKQTDTFGTDHYYNADTYNEMNPSSTENSYLQQSSSAVFNSIRAGDSQGIWVLQGWLFGYSDFWSTQRIEAYLSGVPNDGMIILDLFSDVRPQYDRTSSYFGKPFIYSMLHNFGGNLGLYGRLPHISSAPVKLFQTKSITIAGVGLTPEGINQNFVVYDMLTEMSWRNRAPDLDSWIESYSSRRYGLKGNPHVNQAWRALLKSVYSCSTLQWGVTKSLAVLRPGLHLLAHRTFMPSKLFYRPEVLHDAWISLLRAHETILDDISPYKYDVVDVTRQVLSDMLIPCYAALIDAYQSQNLEKFDDKAVKLLELIRDMDAITATHESFLLGRWIAAAHAMADDISNSDALLYEFNARNQVTLWGPQGEIADYASKQWSGLIASYYLKRWELFVRHLRTAVIERSIFDEKEFNAACFAFETAWQHETLCYPVEPQGDPFLVSFELYRKYFGQTEKLNQSQGQSELNSK